MTLPYEGTSLHGHVHLHAVVGLEGVLQVLDLGDPWQNDTIQNDIRWQLRILSFLCKYNALSFRLLGVRICSKLKVPGSCKLMANVHHLLQTTPACRQKENVVSEHHGAKEDVVDVATKLAASQDTKKFINIDSKEYSGAYPTLPHAITNRKSLGKLPTPLHITLLVLINEEKQPQENRINFPLKQC